MKAKARNLVILILKFFIMKKMKCLDRFKNSPKYGAGEIADYITSRCTDAEMLSVLFELNRRMQKRVESISDQ